MQDSITDHFQAPSERLTDKLESWADGFIGNLPNLIVAALVFGVTYYLAGVLRRQMERRLANRLKEPALRSLVATLSSMSLIALGLLTALNVLNLDTALKSMLAGAGVAGLAVGLALQSSLANTFAGIYLAVNRILRVGDWVETNGYEGFVHEVSLRNTIIRENDNNLVVIPNRLILDKPFKNFGLTKQVRIVLECGVAYDSDLEQVERCAKEAVRANYPHDEGREIEFHYLRFGGSSIDFQLRFWVDAEARMSMLEARSEAIKLLKSTFDENAIEIPFPMRTLEVGQSLAKVMSISRSENPERSGSPSVARARIAGV